MAEGKMKMRLAVPVVVAMCLSLIAVVAPSASAVHGTGDYALAGTGYNFEDISGTGTPVPVVTNCDDCTASIPIGFTFNFYGVDYSDVVVSSNGFLSFGNFGNGCCSGQTIPSAGFINNFIAGYWTDLHPGVGGDVYYQYLNDGAGPRLIVQFEQVSLFDNASVRETFQLKLFEGTDVIEVHYASVGRPLGDHVSAGVENVDGTVGVQYFFDAGNTTADDIALSSTAVCYDPGHGGACAGFSQQPTSGRSISCTPETATNRTGTEHVVTCTVVDQAGQPLQYETVTFTTSGPGRIVGATTAESDFQGRVHVRVTSSESGTQTITATIADDLNGNEPNEVDECDRAAGDPAGSVAGQCSDSVTATYAEDAPPPPPPPAKEKTNCNDGIDNDSDNLVDFPNDPGCSSEEDTTESPNPDDGDGDGERIRVATNLTIRYDRDDAAFKGAAGTSRKACQTGRTVILKKVTPGPNRTVGRDGTNRFGNWRISNARARGRFYAVVLRQDATSRRGAEFDCLRDRSVTVSLRRR